MSLRTAVVSIAVALGGACALSATAQTGEAGASEAVAGKPAAEKPKAGNSSKAGNKAAAKKADVDAKPEAEIQVAEADAPEAAKAGKAAKAAKATPVAGKGIDEVDPNQGVSQTVIDVAAWVISSGDNRKMPFAVVDKTAAQILIFGADGKVRGLAPILIGSATGDDFAEGVADRELKDIPDEQRTTPAGRFVAGFGPATGGDTVLWVDYASAVSLHPMPTTDAAKKEKRKQRLASATPDDNRITHGCINVSSQFYSKIVQPAFQKGGVFYVLPDTVSLQTAIPSYGLAGPPAEPPKAKKSKPRVSRVRAEGGDGAD